MATNLFFKSVLLSIFVVFLPSSIEKPLSPTTKATVSNNGNVRTVIEQPFAWFNYRNVIEKNTGLAVCHLPQEPGFCQGFFPRWFYNHKTKQCQQFIYGGCNGNSNNFLNRAACLLTCHAGKPLGLKSVPVTPTLKPKDKTTSKESRRRKDKKNKNTLPLLSTPSPSQTTKALKPCEIEKIKVLDANQSGIFIPECDHMGYYKEMQCGQPLGLNKSCWCVDKNGRKTGEVRITYNGKQTCDKINKTSLANSPCIKALKQALDASILLQGMPVPINVLGRSYVPECNLNTGLFTPRQCYKTNCWCVDVYTGAEIKNTYGKKGFVKCDS